MKTFSKKILLGAVSILLTSTSLWAQENPFKASSALYAKGGGVQGGGGDAATERRIKDIRDDILKWIKRGDAEKLKFNLYVTYQDYLEGNLSKKLFGMKDILEPGAVVVSAFSEKDEDLNVETLNTSINNAPKVCKGLIRGINDRPTIVCKKEAFEALSEKEQYIQIHHEYAGLGGLERNIGADSDYNLSSQITNHGSYEKIFRLAINNTKEKKRNYGDLSDDLSDIAHGTILIAKKDIHIKPNTKKVLVGMKASTVDFINLGASSSSSNRYSTYSYVNKCYLILRSKSANSRVIKKGTNLLAVSTNKGIGSENIRLDNDSIKKITCTSGTTVGNFIAMNEFNVRFPDPIEL